LHDLDRAWRVWLILRAVDFKWTPKQIEEQEEALLDDIMAIAFVQQRIEEIEHARANDHD
jgi:hypothetical protein